VSITCDVYIEQALHSLNS